MADVYDALVSKRVYKAAYSPDTAVQMILHGDCGSSTPCCWNVWWKFRTS